MKRSGSGLKYDRDEIREPFMELYNSQYSVRKIAQSLGVSQSTVTRILQEYGLTGNVKAKNNRERVAELYAEDWSDQKISEELGISREAVAKIRQRLGLITPHFRYPEEKKLEVLKLLQDGTSYGEAARTAKIPGSLPRKWFPGMGWTKEQVNEYQSVRRLAGKLDI